MLQAASLVHLLSKEDKVVVSLASSEPLMLALIKALDAPDEVTKRHAAAALCHLSAHQTGAHHIFRSGGIAELVRMLRCPILSIIHYAVTTLHHLLVYVEMAKEEAIVCGALEALVPLLAPQTAIPQSGPNPKLQAMSNSVYVKLFYAVVRCIRSISTCSENKASLIAIGGLELLHRTFNLIDDDKRKLATLSAIRNLSDVATNLETLTPLVAELVALIGDHNDEELVSCACGILSNLTCNNILNKNTVCTSSGIPILARALSKFSNIEDVTEPALCTLRHCTVRHPLAFQAQNELRFAYPIILTLLSTQRPPIVKAALGLVRNCSLSNENLKRMLSEKTPDGDTVLTLSLELLEQSGKQLVQDWGGLCDGVSLLEMVEGAISALHQLAKDGTSASQIFNRSTIMKLLVYLMSNEKVNKNEDELMMREIMGLVYQLTKSREGAKAVLTYEAQPYISAALSSQHKSIAAYASIILKNMGVEQLRVQNFNNTFAGQIAPGVYGVSNGFDSQPMSAENTLERTNGAHRHHQMGWQNDGMEPELYNELYNYPPSLGELRQDHIEGSANNGSCKNGCTQSPLTVVEFYNAMKPPLIFLEKSIPVNDTFEVLIWMGNWAVLGGSGGRTTSLSPFTSKFGRVQVCVSDILVMVRTGEKQFVIGNSSSELLVLNSRDTVDTEESISKVPTFSTVQCIKLSSDEHISAIGCSKTMKPQMMAVGKVNGLTLFLHEKTQWNKHKEIDIPHTKENANVVWSLVFVDTFLFTGDARGQMCIYNAQNGTLLKVLHSFSYAANE
uniref:Armadillo repeat-containing protein 8 n=1 Tax=Globodera pallida TaxID=36090 RepID=A0A183CKR2_GLOPA